MPHSIVSTHANTVTIDTALAEVGDLISQKKPLDEIVKALWKLTTFHVFESKPSKLIAVDNQSRKLAIRREAGLLPGPTSRQTEAF